MSVRAVLIGMPGSGKSTVGKLLADALGCEFLDSDALIVAEQRRTIPEIFAADGEAGFRAVEAATISRALTDRDGVLSLGGGAVLAESTREALKGHPVVFIDVEHEELVRRIAGSSTARPLVDDDPRIKLALLREQRDHLYRRCARHTVSSDAGPVQTVVGRVLDVLGETGVRLEGGDGSAPT